jgi:hypothetical protein
MTVNNTDVPAEKRCPACGETKAAGEFNRNQATRDGLNSQCKVCSREADRRRYAADPEKYREASRRRAATNPERRRDSDRRWRAANPARVRARNQRTHAACPPEYRSWEGMRRRCSNPKADNYAYYGARGIYVCERWRTFQNFLTDMGPRPPGKTLDRIDVNGNYEPGNCRWATASEQRANQRPRQPAAGAGRS